MVVFDKIFAWMRPYTILTMRCLMRANYVQATPILVADTSTLSAVNYSLLGELAQPCYYIQILNTSTNPVLISLDNVNDNFYIFPGIPLSFPAQDNAQKRDTALFRKGQQFYIKGTPSAGFLTISGLYQPQI